MSAPLVQDDGALLALGVTAVVAGLARLSAARAGAANEEPVLTEAQVNEGLVELVVALGPAYCASIAAPWADAQVTEQMTIASIQDLHPTDGEAWDDIIETIGEARAQRRLGEALQVYDRAGVPAAQRHVWRQDS